MLDLSELTTIESIKMINNKVLIEPVDTESLSEYTTDSGIQVIKSNYRSKRKYLRGKIAKLGSHITIGNHRLPLSEYFNIGDEVFYFESGVTEIKINDKVYVIVRAEDIEGCIVTD